MPILESEFQNLSTVQGPLQPGPGNIASAATIAPTTLISMVSGTGAIATITPPIAGSHMLILIPTGAWTVVATGNISIAMAAATPNQPVLAIYNPVTKKYYLGKVTSA